MVEKVTVIIEPKVDPNATKKVVDGLDQKLGAGGEKAGNSFSVGFKSQLTVLNVAIGNIIARGVTTAVASIKKALSDSIADLRDFSRGIAEINSILPRNEKLTRDSERSIIAFSSQFASQPQEQARAFYNIVSAGVKGTATQLKTLEAANKAAVAGLVDINRAAKVLVSSVNSYSKSGLTAEQASDSLFAAVREGQTTFSELSDTIGIVAPLASAAGLKFNELTGALAAITKSGVRTDQAVTGIKAVLTSLLKPTSDAEKEAKKLGIQFNIAGLQAKGFAKFIRDIERRTGGSAESIAKLFGNVRALTPILQLANSETKNFEDVLKATANAAGDTARAFKIISENLDFKLKKRSQEFRNFFLALSTSVKQVFGDAIFNTLPTVNLLTESLIAVGTAINNFVIAPLELLFNVGRVVFNFFVTAVAETVAQVASLGTGISALLNLVGVNNSFTKFFDDFASSSRTAADNAFGDFGQSLDDVFQGTVFGKGEEFLEVFTANIEAAKNIIDGSGIAESLNGEKPGEDVEKSVKAVQGLSIEFGKSTRDMSNEAIKLEKVIAKSIGNAMVKTVVSAAKSIGAALAGGGISFKAFLGTVLNIIGDLLIEIGAAAIAIGLGVEAIKASVVGLSAGPALAAGFALVALGAALKGFGASQGGGSGGTVGSSGGGIAAGGDGQESIASDQLQEDNEPQTTVTLNVQGDVLDSQETGLRLVDIINNAFESDGAVITNGAFA